MVATSAASLRENGWNLAVIDEWARETGPQNLLNRLFLLDTDALIVHVDSMNSDVVLEVIWALRRRRGLGLPIIAMGQLAEVFPERLLGPIGPFDACVLGEPERTLPELLNALVEGQQPTDIAGTAWVDRQKGHVVVNPRRPVIEDLDSLPVPAYDLFDLDAYAKESAFVPVMGRVRWGWILSSRGCPFNCLFCSPTLRKSCGSAYRAHSPKYVGDLAERLVREHACNALAFEDDAFSLDRDRTIAICDELSSRNLGVYWTAQTHLATLDEEVISAMARAGCRGLCVGIEAGNDDVRRQLKGGSLSRKTIIDNVALLHKYGIEITAYFMIGSPGETLSQMNESLDLAREINPMMIQVAFFTPYPGSRAWKQYMVEGRHEPEMSHYNKFGVNFSAETRDVVRAFHGHFYRSFYMNPKWLARYLTKRLPYVLAQGRGRELKLLFSSLLFLATPVHNLRADSIDSVRRK